MADYRTEEEQIELLKKWWQENGKSLLMGVVLALTGYFGWTGWTSHQQALMADAADLYQEMLLAGEAGDNPGRVTELANQLRQQHPATVYAVFAALQLARTAVEAGDLPGAAGLLEATLQQKPDPALVPLVSWRLAQIQYAQGEADAALATLGSAGQSTAWMPVIEELRGDILRQQGKPDEARQRYEAALKALDASVVQDRRADLEMKLVELAAPSAPGQAAEGDQQS